MLQSRLNEYTSSPLSAFFIIIVAFLVKSFIVMYTYNFVAPRLISNMTGNQNVKHLEFTEAMAFTLLANCLFN